jgi:hypothetical protein
MREEKRLIRILRDLADLISTEAGRNTEFAERLDVILEGVPERKVPPKRRGPTAGAIPDVFAEMSTRDPVEFELWLSGLDILTLKAIVRKHDFDSSHRTSKWSEPEKLAKFIHEQLRARMDRGSSFLKGGRSDTPPK